MKARRGQDGGRQAARAGAGNRVTPARVSPGLLAAQAADRAYFEAHPDARSYTRPMFLGELPAHIADSAAGNVILGVAVAPAGYGIRMKVVITDPNGFEEARRSVEASAEIHLAALAGRGPSVPPAFLGGKV